MERVKDRCRIVLLLLALSIPAALHGREGDAGREPRIPEADRFPMRVGAWSGVRAPVDESVYRILETRDVLLGRFSDGYGNVVLSLVRYPSVEGDFHRPESCNVGRGDRLEPLGRRTLAFRDGEERLLLPANFFLVHRPGGDTELFCYFYQSGERFEAGYVRMRISMALRYLRLRRADAAVVIVATPVLSGVPEAEALIGRFLGEILPELRRSAR